MIVEGTMIAPAVENEMEAWMLANRFSAMRAQFHAEALLNGAGQNPRLGHRLADRLIQRLRKAGKIRFERENGGVVWRAVA